MTTLNLTEHQLRDARKQFGRSAMMQLLIFLGIEFGVLIVHFILSVAQSLLLTLINNTAGVNIGPLQMTIGQSYAFISYVFSFISFVVTIAVIFLHRSVTFRSADSVLHNVLPLAGLMIISSFVGNLISNIIVNLNSQALIDALARNPYAAPLYVLFSFLYLLTNTLVIFSTAGTIRLACKKTPLFLLPLLALIPASVLNSLIVSCISYSYEGTLYLLLRRSSEVAYMLYVGLSLLMQQLLPWLVCGTASFFAMRKLVYRDTCDTAPKAQQQILQRYLTAYPLVLKQTVPVTPAESVAPQQPLQPAQDQAAPAAPTIEVREEE